MLTTDLFDKLNLNKNYDFPCDVLELPANFGYGEGEQLTQGQTMNNSRTRIQTQAVCLQSTHSKAQMKIAAINRSQVFSTQRDLRIITNYN